MVDLVIWSIEVNVFHCPDWMFDPLIDCVVKRGQETKYDLRLNPYDLWRNFIDNRRRKSFYLSWKSFLHVTFCLRFEWSHCLPGDRRVRCTGMSCHVMEVWTLWRALVWPPVRVCEIRGCLFISTMPLSYCIRPQTFVMVMLLVCCTAGFSLGLRDSLVSGMNEDIPQQPPIHRPFYNTQERDTHLLLNIRHALAHLKLFFPWTLGHIWTSN